MLGRLKPKKLTSATLSEAWPQPVFPFKGVVGHFPQEAQPYVFVSRWDAKTGRHTVRPDMLYPIEANRQPVPRHMVLEDEYRAYHNVIVNQKALQDKFLPQDVDRGNQVSVMRQRVVNINHAINSGQISNDSALQEKLPKLQAYKPSVNPPPGYAYRRFREGTQRDYRTEDRTIHPPIVHIRDPFQNTVNLCPPQHCTRTLKFDSAVIGGGPPLGEVRIFNEPDAISITTVNAHTRKPLPERAMLGLWISKKRTMRRST